MRSFFDAKISNSTEYRAADPRGLTNGLIDARALAATVKGLEERLGYPCVLIIIDTVTRTFGAGDQHQSRDMQRYIQSAAEIHSATSAHIALTKVGDPFLGYCYRGVMSAIPPIATELRTSRNVSNVPQPDSSQVRRRLSDS
jgi:hypothetical protein